MTNHREAVERAMTPSKLFEERMKKVNAGGPKSNTRGSATFQVQFQSIPEPKRERINA
jgi:hypothetical protein